MEHRLVGPGPYRATKLVSEWGPGGAAGAGRTVSPGQGVEAEVCRLRVLFSARRTENG